MATAGKGSGKLDAVEAIAPLAGPEGMVVAGAIELKKQRDAKQAEKRAERRAKRQENLDKGKAEYEEYRLNLGRRMHLPWWLSSILATAFYVPWVILRTAKKGLTWGIDFVMRPTKWILEKFVSPIVQIPFKILGTTIGSILAVLIIIGMIVGGAYFFATTYPPVMVWFVERGIDDIGDFFNWLATIPANISENISEWFKKRMDMATGVYNTAECEGECIEQGIFLEDVRAMQSKFYAGEPIIIMANLRGSGNFDDVEGTLSVSCLIVEDNAEAYKIYPSEDIELWTLSNSMEGFECEFIPYDTIDEANKEVKVTIQFPFQTKGRVTLIFMDEDTIRQLSREGKSANEVYNIEPKPISVFQPGPIMVALGTVRSNPIAIGGTKRVLTTVGFTLENRWEGEIINITDVEIIVDSGISLPEDENTLEMEGPIPIGGGRDKYIVDKNYLERLTGSGKDPIKSYVSLNFRMELDKGVLKNTVLSHKEIEMKVEYDYRLWKRTNIQLDYDPWHEEQEETRGVCGTESCSDREVCCENDYNPERRECRVGECPTHWKDVTDQIMPPEEGSFECGDKTCSEGEVCCRCTSTQDCVNPGSYTCKAESVGCDPYMYTEVTA